MTNEIALLSDGDQFVAAVLDAMPDYHSDSLEAELLMASLVEEVVDAPGMEQALEVVAALKAYTKDTGEIVEHFKPFNNAANDLRNKMAQLRDGYLEAPIEHIKRLEGLVLAYRQMEAEKERARLAEQERVAKVEAERVAEEKRQEIADQAAAQLALARTPEDAAAIMEQADMDAADVRPVEILPPPPLFTTAQVTSATAKAAGSSFTTRYKAKLVDLRQLIAAAATNPEAYINYLCFNQEFADKIATMQKEAFAKSSPPGVELETSEGITTRGRKK